MRQHPREAALDFLRDEHLLEDEEAARALVLADSVLHDGLTRLGAAASEGDPAGCHEAAHALKGNLLNLGLFDLARQAESIVAAAKHGATDACRHLSEEFTQALVPFFS